jgi:hypothetical protein
MSSTYFLSHEFQSRHVFCIQILDLSLRKQNGLNSKYRAGLSTCLETYVMIGGCDLGGVSGDLGVGG